MSDLQDRSQTERSDITQSALTLDNPEFIRFLKAKDNSAWDLVVDRYAKTLHSDILQSLEKRNLAVDHVDDIQQQTWLSAITKIDAFIWHDETKFYHWLRSIATQHVLTLRYRMKRNPLSLEEMDEVIEGLFLEIVLYSNGLAEDAPEEHFTLYETLALLDDAMQQLKPRVREILVRRYLLDETSREMAEAYHVKPETISIILNRAKKTIRVYLEMNNYDAK